MGKGIEARLISGVVRRHSESHSMNISCFPEKNRALKLLSGFDDFIANCVKHEFSHGVEAEF